MTSPTGKWLAATAEFMRPLEGAAGVAERLLLLLHYSIDWDNSWVRGYRSTYWDKILPDRVLVAAYQAVTLRQWWTQIADELVAHPTREDARRELVALLEVEHGEQVLACLTNETLALLLRVRIVAETRRNK